jgi:tetratricopeptide (TPR) repeat protein
MFFDLAKEALRASGLKDEKRVLAYLDRLELLSGQFSLRTDAALSDSARAATLFEKLWRHRPGRYRAHGTYRLNQVIDAQLQDGNHPVGNCLGLTLLYNCLLEKIGIQAEALHLQNAFKKGPHVLTLLRTGEETIQIENIFPHGFDYKGHRHGSPAERWGPKELVADIYHSAANELFEQGRLSPALESYNMALKLNPHYESARLNKAILIDRMAMVGSNGSRNGK